MKDQELNIVIENLTGEEALTMQELIREIAIKHGANIVELKIVSTDEE